jgi:hypothetical protein
VQRGIDRPVLVQAADEVIKRRSIGRPNAFEPTRVQAVVDNLACPIARDRTCALTAGLDHSAGAQDFDALVVAVTDPPRAVDLYQRSVREPEGGYGGIDISVVC